MRRVTFDVPDESQDILDKFGKILSDSALYPQLLAHIREVVDTSVDLAIKCLCTATSHISLISQRHRDLVNILLRINWLSSDSEELVDAYCQFVANLVSAHSTFVVPVARNLIGHFSTAGTCCFSDSKGPGTSRLHVLIARILCIIPSGSSLLVPILTENFPHKRESTASHTAYLENLLSLLNYAPAIREQVLELIVDRLFQIDVEIQVELDDLDEESCEKVQEMVFEDISSHPAATEETDLEEDEGSDDDDVDSVMALNIREMVEKLDAMLVILMQYINSLEQIHRDNPEDFTELVYPLLGIFQKSALSTHQSRYTQFLWFYLCSLDTNFADTFLGMLVTTAFNDPRTNIRINAISYIASYMARAKYLDLGQVKTCIRVLNTWCLGFISSQSPKRDWKQHSLFYTTVQALLYIFCFRWRELLMDADSDVVHGKFPAEMSGFQNVIMSKFRPLQYCSQPIAEEFAKITLKLEIIYCYGYMGTPLKNGLDDSTLDAFFPFDPLSLKRAGSFVDGLYQVWESVDDEVDEDEHMVVVQPDQDFESGKDEYMEAAYAVDEIEEYIC